MGFGYFYFEISAYLEFGACVLEFPQPATLRYDAPAVASLSVTTGAGRSS